MTLKPAERRILFALATALLVVVCFGALWFITALFDHVHNTMIVIILAILFAYAVYPPIRRLARLGVPIVLGGVIVYAVLFLLLGGALAWLAPAIAAQAAELAHNYPRLVAQTQTQLADPAHAPLLAHFPTQIRLAIAANAGKAAAYAGVVAGAFGSHAIEIVSTTTGALINTSLVLGLTLLMVTELADIQTFAVRMVPKRHRTAALSFMDEVDTVIGGFVRGQVILALSVAVAGTIVLMAVGIPYAILLGVLAGIVSIIPLVGPVAAYVPVLLIAFFTVGLVKTVIVAVLFGIIIGLQQNVLVPVFVARSVGISPLVIFVALLMGSEAFGILGALLSVPIAGILRVAAERIFPPDPAADDLTIAARDAAGEPHPQTIKAANS